ncbi:MAG: DNA primase [Verrucomicrobia bacterium]|nr:DNA primase [Verrucomicrobiota bacterium]
MPGLISPATLDQIRAANDIVEVVGSYLPLKRAGANFVALCPFHKERTPSFHVNPHRQIFHCFGCHKGGDVYTFIREYENLTFVEAVRRLAERAKIPLEFDTDPRATQTRFLKDTLLQIHEQIAQRWHAALTHDAAGQTARAYLERRGVSPDAIGLFRLGYAPEAWDDTVNWAKSKGHDLALLEQTGLVVRKEGDTHCYDRFRSRLMFPICDEQGRVVAFSGRILSGDEKTAKYVNSPETPIFTKGKIMFGLDKSKRAILDAGYAVICEGQLDLIACYLADVRNVVAPQGTALTADHCRILKRFTDEVVLCFDSDAAGQNAALRALDDLLASGLAIRVASVPAPHDPDSFIRAHGGPAFRDLIQRAQGFFDFLLEHLCATHDLASDRGRLTVTRVMAEALHKTANAVLLDAHALKTAQRLGVSPEAVRAEFRRAARAAPAPSRPRDPNPAPTEAVPAVAPSSQEFWLLKLLLLDDELPAWAALHLDPLWIQHPLVRSLIERRFAAQAEGNWRGVAALLGETQDPAAQRLITEAVAEHREIKHRAEQLADVVKRQRDQYWSREIAALTRQIADPATDEAARLEMLRRQQQLRLAKQQPLQALV